MAVSSRRGLVAGNSLSEAIRFFVVSPKKARGKKEEFRMMKKTRSEVQCEVAHAKLTHAGAGIHTYNWGSAVTDRP